MDKVLKYYHSLNIESARTRRLGLIDEMKALGSAKIDCFNCTGTCCTQVANSMQVTPLEAMEILLSLDPKEIDSTKEKLKSTIDQFRLDHEIFTGKKGISTLRKTYTCPFFSPGPKGCGIKKEYKPYGCLGFNPRLESDNGSQCTSNTALLESREEQFIKNEDQINEKIRLDLKLDWIKKDIPRALIDLIGRLS
jgi:Fe-S-cluster containining protein